MSDLKYNVKINIQPWGCLSYLVVAALCCLGIYYLYTQVM